MIQLADEPARRAVRPQACWARAYSPRTRTKTLFDWHRLSSSHSRSSTGASSASCLCSRWGPKRELQIDRLIGNVAIHEAAETNTKHPTPRMNPRSLVLLSRVLIPAKNRDVANSTTPST